MKIKKSQFFMAALATMPILVSLASCASSKPEVPKLPAAKQAVSSVYYASPQGSGSACTLAAPCTLTGVRDKVREVSAKMTRDIKVVLRGGNYYLSSPLTLTEKDSGQNGYKVLWISYAGETAELVGGSRVTGWTRDAGGVYKANVGAGTIFHTLYENGVRAVKARYPNTGYLNDVNGSGGIGDPGYLDAWIQFKEGEVPNWPDIVGGELNTWGYFNWFQSVLPIKAFDHANRKITMTRPPMFGFIDPKTTPYGFKQNEHDRFFIQNVKSALDVAGEFYLDQAAGILYYYPRSAAPIEDQIIVMPKMKRVLELKGSSPTALIRNIQFENIKVSSSDFIGMYDFWEDPTKPLPLRVPVGESNKEAEAVANRHGNIYLTNARNITLKTMEVVGSGYSGILLDMYCQQIIVFNSQIHDVGYVGVLIVGVKDLIADPAVSRDNLIQNNHIYNISQLIGQGAGIALGSDYTFLNHNEIHTGNRHGIVAGGSYNIPSSASSSAHNLISYNRVYDMNNDSQDTANIYQYAGGRHNVYDHNITYESNGMTVNSGFYLDNHSDYVTLSNNIVYDSEKISQNDNFPTIKLINNVLTHVKAEWIAAGLDSTQMGRVPMTNPVWPGAPKSFLLNAGASSFGSFTSDVDFYGGATASTPVAVDTSKVVRPAPPKVYQSARVGKSFKYVLPNLMANGTYKVRLHFAELTHKAANQRKFNVAINGAAKLTNFDIFAAAGGAHKATVKDFTVNADGEGQIAIEFSGAVGEAQINAIEVLAPVTINAGGTAAELFGNDVHYVDGTTISGPPTSAGVLPKIDTTGTKNPAPQAVYQNIRYGLKTSFGYAIPGLVPDASYKVRLHFAELFGATAGQRQLHVDINGARKLTNFDIFVAAGGAHKATIQEFVVNADSVGQIAIQFTMGIENPLVNGIEVIAN